MQVSLDTNKTQNSIVFPCFIYKMNSRNSSAAVVQGDDSLKFEGCSQFRQRIACSILSGRAIKIESIRPPKSKNNASSNKTQIGILDFEASFLRVVDKITNGTKIEINEAGTAVYFSPGFITNGSVQHDCGTSKSIGWFLEGLIPIVLFGKKPVKLKLTGITNENSDISVDTIKAVTIPFIKRFGVAEEGGLELKVLKRGAPPKGGGEIEFICPIVKQLKTINFTDPGLIRRVRGNAVCTKVSPQIANRVAESSRSVLNKLIPDVWVHTDQSGGIRGGLSPGFSCCLVAESTTGVLLSAEIAAMKGSIPEDLGVQCSERLLTEIDHQSLAMILMILCSEDVSRLRIGKLTAYSVQYLRHLRDFFGVMFKLKADTETSTVLLSCLGIGYKNISRSTT